MKTFNEAHPPAALNKVRDVPTLCPYCGVGCALHYGVDEAGVIQYARGRNGASNAGRLCVKGRYGFDYAGHPQRLTRPLIRRDSAYPRGPLSGFSRQNSSGPRKPGGIVDYDEVLPHFREASWEEALDRVAAGLGGIRDTHGPDALAGFGSAKGSNEEAYLFQKFIRAVLGTNNVDHCTRLCHASSVYALIEGIGSGAVTNVVRDIENAEVAVIAGCNPTANHPVAATFMKQAASAGTDLLAVNVRRPGIADYCRQYCQIKPGADVAFYNAVMQVIIAEGLHDRTFIDARTGGFEALQAAVAHYTPAVAEPLTGIPASEIIAFARRLGQARSAMFFWGMGISQHVFGTDNARCLIALALLTGNIGRPGTGLHPLRGQNNVQGASDAGLIPMYYPGYQSVADPEVQRRFEALWGVDLPNKPGLTTAEITHAALDGDIRGLYCMGENPFLSDPDMNRVREALASLDFLVVQDLFITETAEFADVILPASAFMEKRGTFTNTDRRVQIGRPVREPPGEARQDWHILRDLAQRLGHDWGYADESAVFDEFVETAPPYANLTYERLGEQGRWYPCPSADSEGERVLFSEVFPIGRARFVPAELGVAPDLPDDDYPLVLNTGRQLEHWHTGVMTRRSRALDAIAPEARVEVHPDDAARLGISEGQWTQIASRRGDVQVQAHLTRDVATGTLFLPMHFREAAANLLTSPELDPFGKIPEFKICAVRLVPLSPPSTQTPPAGVSHAAS
ncbi:formate dehydrogenase subunit alpha [Spiribacter salinus M19-40]|uniref:nitrate reductase (cytochrome) n=1 Tax=Spiribacter salinus M19-40 TaxID=1260251 RepID=R4V2P6_9GAMM|nr:formate dehydrogenase subunit alpha [Spiribacter salinus]AGM40269.1 formate dehydrogenase subunit alpha [Spiribacter salinus M19-40]